MIYVTQAEADAQPLRYLCAVNANARLRHLADSSAAGPNVRLSGRRSVAEETGGTSASARGTWVTTRLDFRG